MIAELLSMLRYKSEGPDVDFKSAQYRFIGGNEDVKGELLKDILAMANAWRDGPGYIALGFKENRPHPAEVVGILESIDDAQLQQFVHGKVKPKLTFTYEEHLFEGKTVGLISIPKQKRAFYLAHSYGKLKSNVVYVRRGSSTDEAEPSEVQAMGFADAGRGEIRVDLKVTTKDNLDLPEIFEERRFVQVPARLPDYAPPEPTIGSFHFPGLRSPLTYDNKNFWREFAQYMRIRGALIDLKVVVCNHSGIQLTNAKLEVTVDCLDDQMAELLEGSNVPDMPKTEGIGFTTAASLIRADRSEPSLVIDKRGQAHVCKVRFGSILPSEEGRSDDTLAIIPSGPGKIRLGFRVLAAELPTPLNFDRTIDVQGSTLNVDVDSLEDSYGRYLLARANARSKDK